MSRSEAPFCAIPRCLPQFGVMVWRRQRECASGLVESLLRAAMSVTLSSNQLRVNARSVFLSECLGVGVHPL